MESFRTSCKISTLLLLLFVGCYETAPSNFIGGDGGNGDACGAKPAEIVFLLDSSSSIWAPDFDKQLNFVKEVVKTFEIGPDKTRVGVASFSDEYHENFGLDRYSSAEDVESALNNIPQLLGGTKTYKALNGVRTQILSKLKTRPGIARILIVLTDGESYNPKKTKEAAKEVKDDGIVVFAVGIGSQTNTEELVSIASTPKIPEDKYLFEVENFDELDITVKDKLTTKACEVEIEETDESEVESQEDDNSKVEITEDDEKEEDIQKDDGPTCGAKNMADVMFLLDPAEIGTSHSKFIFEFIGNVITDFNMGKDNIQVGLEAQNCGAANITLGKYNNSRALARAFRNTQMTGLSQMLKRLRTHSFRKENGARAGARQMAVVFVDDRLFNRKMVLDEARRTKNSNVELFVVAIGDSVVEDELLALCSSPVQRHLIRIPSYESLLQSKPGFMTKFCLGL